MLRNTNKDGSANKGPGLGLLGDGGWSRARCRCPLRKNIYSMGDPGPCKDGAGSAEMGFTGGGGRGVQEGSSFLLTNWPGLETGGSFPQPDHLSQDVFVTLQGRGVRILLVRSSLSQRSKGTSHRLARSCGMGSCRTGHQPLSHPPIFRCSLDHKHTRAAGRLSTGIPAGGTDFVVSGQPSQPGL